MTWRAVSGRPWRGVSNDRALIREFQRAREWKDYKGGLVEEIVARKQALKGLR